MPLDIVRDVFDPIAKHVESEYDSRRLRKFLDRKYPRGVPNNAGLERNWFKDEVRKALHKPDPCFKHRGPDIVLRDGTSTMMVELRAAYDLNPSDTGTTPREGVLKYCDDPEFAGCIFLGRCSTKNIKSKIKKLERNGIMLKERLTFEEGDFTWIVGLLISRKKTEGGRPKRSSR